MALSFVSHFGFIALLFTAPACVSTNPPTDHPSSTASRREVIAAALTLEKQETGRGAMSGSGESMAPVYGENSVIVTRPIAYDDLEAGMIVAFLSEEKGRVVHQLIRKTSRGWKTQGFNNPFEDSGYVTPENLLGVVYAVFQGSADEPR